MTFKKLVLSPEQIKDVKNIARGVYAPLQGFLNEKDFKSVVSEMRLSNGAVWPIPIVLDISEMDRQQIKNARKVILVDFNQKPVAILRNPQVYPYNKDFFAKNVFGTIDRNHPGVDEVYKMQNYLIGGGIEFLEDDRRPFPKYNLTPKETKNIFRQKGWKTVVGFQTRNVPHRSHEFLQKEALKQVDGLFIQPVIGEKKLEDFKDEYILAGYEILIEKFYPRERVVLGILPLKMRYAGPREALFHALIRKNFGCSHFIVGRDHAGVGNYYSPFAAQEIFEQFKKQEIGIEILKYPEVVYCPDCKKHVFVNQCPHPSKISLSGTEIRKTIQAQHQPPSFMMRPEVYNLLSQSFNSLVDAEYKKTSIQKGFVIWLTGLSQAGKTTIGNRVYAILKKRGLKVERLDGDIVRQHLSQDLGFSKRDRDENIKRIGFVSKLLAQNGIGVIASFISPYRRTRDEVRKNVDNFIEVFCNAPLEVCEKRDAKGLYRKARSGQIQNFTGISDPYEAPLNPELELKTDTESIEESANKVIKYLENKRLVLPV